MLGTAIDIQRWLREDQALPVEARHERDRAIALRVTANPDALTTAARNEQRQAVLAWWQALAVAGHPTIDRGVGLVSMALGAIGFVLGLAAAGGALTYSGAHPVNLVSLLALLIGLPGLFLLGTLLLLPPRLPGFGWLRGLLASVNVGHWATLWLNRLLPEPLLGWLPQETSRARPVSKWLMLRAAQCFAIGFFLGALLALLWLVVFSDLAFGWSTTLQADPAQVAAWFQGAALPWAQWLPAAYPSTELVQQSRFFRGAADALPVQNLGAWWPFVLMCLLVYGLLPRVLLYVVSRWRYAHSVSDFLIQDPEVQRLLRRMGSAWVARGANTPDDSHVPPDVPQAAAVQLPQGSIRVAVWNDALSEAEVTPWCARHGVQAASAVRLGSALSLAQEQDLTTPLAGSHVLVLTKAWEPPLLELHDMLQRLATTLGEGGRVFVQPVGVAGAPAAASDLDVWRQSLHRLQHPHVLMASPE